MKKIVSLLIILVIVATALVACSEEPEAPVAKDYSLAIGVVVPNTLDNGKLTETVATIVTDSDGKIVLCRFDCVQYKSTDTTAPTSKAALGDNYMMPAGSWAKQTAAFEKFLVGKTQAEVAAIVLNGGKLTDANADLAASCSYDISDLIKAVDKAFNSTHKVTFSSAAESFTAGLAVTGTVDAAKAQYVADFSAVVMADGAVVAAIIDCADAKIVNNAEVQFSKTKREQGDDYKMTGGAWYVQTDAFTKTAVGKTAADIDGLAIEGVAGCTMPNSPAGFKTGLVAAVKGAR